MKKVLTYGNYKIEIEQDTDAQNPREWGNAFSQCIFFHRNYSFGDKHDINADDYNSFDEMEKALRKNYGAVVILPVYMYEHSGITIRTSSFNDRWDSGQLGFIIATKEMIKAAHGEYKRLSPKLRAQVERNLKGDIETLDQYLTGDVYGFRVLEEKTVEVFGETVTDTDEIDSCWGFYGNEADNGIFDHIYIEGLTFETYKELFNQADWVFEDSYSY